MKRIDWGLLVLVCGLFVGAASMLSPHPNAQTLTPVPPEGGITITTGPFVWGGEAPEIKPIPGPFSSLKVGPFIYKVRWYAGYVPNCGRNFALGCTDVGEQFMNIKLNKESPLVTRDTVLHELLHVVFGFDKNRGNATDEDEFTEEDFAYKSPVLLMILRDNPDLTKFLLEK